VTSGVKGVEDRAQLRCMKEEATQRGGKIGWVKAKRRPNTWHVLRKLFVPGQRFADPTYASASGAHVAA